MTNNEIIVKIRAEIERRITISDLDNPIGLWSATALTSLLSFLSDLEKSLPSKVSDSKGLEVEAVNYIFDNGLNISPKVATDFARHFYELGCHRAAEKFDELEYNRQRAEESGCSEIPKDLEEAAENYEHNRVYQRELELYENYIESLGEDDDERTQKVPPSPNAKYLLNADIIDAFIAGAKWDREQIMKNAKNGWMDEEDVIILNDGTRIDLQPDYDKKPAFEFEYAQNVQVIILPKEN